MLRLSRHLLVASVIAFAITLTIDDIVPDAEACHRARVDQNNNNVANCGEPALAAFHWNDGNNNGPGFVTMVDRTGANWPVQGRDH